MQIGTFATAPRSTDGVAATSQDQGTASPTRDANSMFMKLLTAQLKNQSPLNPVDPMQFTTQLVQFNMLDQLLQIRSLMQKSEGATGQPAIPGQTSKS